MIVIGKRSPFEEEHHLSPLFALVADEPGSGAPVVLTDEFDAVVFFVVRTHAAAVADHLRRRATQSPVAASVAVAPVWRGVALEMLLKLDGVGLDDLQDDELDGVLARCGLYEAMCVSPEDAMAFAPEMAERLLRGLARHHPADHGGT